MRFGGEREALDKLRGALEKLRKAPKEAPYELLELPRELASREALEESVGAGVQLAGLRGVVLLR